MSGISPIPPAPGEPPAPRSGWTLSRVLALIAGAVLLYMAIRASRGMALGGVLGMLLLVRVQSGRGRRATRPGTWLASCVACAGGIIVFMAAGMAKMPSGSLDHMMAQVIDSVRAQQQRTPPPKLPPALQRLQPQDSASLAAQRAAQIQAMQMIGSPGFMRYVIVVGVSLGSAMLGMILGTLTWGGAFFLARGVYGVWPLAAPPPAPE